MRHALALLAASAALLAACGSDKTPVSFSQPVGISLPVQSKDVAAGSLAANKNINTESGNPYGAFTQAARNQLGGRDPSRIVVTGIALDLLASSTNVSALEQVFTGPVTVSFQTSTATYPVGSVTNPTSAGPAQLTVAFDSGQLSPAENTAIYQGQFKVMLEGPAATSFSTANATADLQTTFTFVAYE